MTNSISATERVRLWNRFHQPLDHENVKLEFFRRVNTRHPPYRTRTNVSARAHIEVPAIVRYHYEHPPALLPSMRQTLRYDRVKRRPPRPVSTARAPASGRRSSPATTVRSTTTRTAWILH